MSTTLTAVPKRKKRQLSNKNLLKSSETPTITPPKTPGKKRKRQLQAIITNVSRSPSPSITPISTKTNIPSPSDETSIPNKTNIAVLPRRSIRAASDAITKREQEKVRLTKEQSESPPATPEGKKPSGKKRRKLNCKKVVMVPSSTTSPDELGLEDVPVDTYSKYLNPKAQPSIPIAPVVIGVRKRKIIQREHQIKPPPKIKSTVEEEGKVLDLSQHSILPNSSYIAHLSKRRLSVGSSTGNYSSDESCNISMASSSYSSEFFDAKTDVFNATPEPSDKKMEFIEKAPQLIDTTHEITDKALELLDISTENSNRAPEIVDIAPEIVDITPETIDIAPEPTAITPEPADITLALVDPTQELHEKTPEYVDTTSDLADSTLEYINKAPELAYKTPELTYKALELDNETAENTELLESNKQAEIIICEPKIHKEAPKAKGFWSYFNPFSKY